MSDPLDDLRAVLAEDTNLAAHLAPLASILDDVRAVVVRYVVLTPAQADAIALWTAHTHALHLADATPYLAVASAEKRSGKTRLLEMLAELAARPWFTGRTTAAALIRKIDHETPTLLLDESDAAFKGDKEYAEALRGVLNSGHRRGGKATVCVGQGAKIEVRDFEVFGPKAIAGIGKLPDTVTDRAITIAMKRRAPGEAVARFRHKAVQAACAPVRDALAAWAARLPGECEEPAIPAELDDRAADGWEPLLAIADLAGEGWPERARAAALALSAGGARDDDSIGVRLLSDIRAIFDAADVDRIPSAGLAAALAAIEDAPWGAWGKREKPMDARALARLLGRYTIKPNTVRDAGETFKGYRREWFGDAFSRYLPGSERHTVTLESSAPPFESGDVTVTQPSQPPLVTVADRPSSVDSEAKSGVCDGVTAGDPSTGMGAADAFVCADCGAEADRYDGDGSPLCATHEYMRRRPAERGHGPGVGTTPGTTLAEGAGTIDGNQSEPGYGNHPRNHREPPSPGTHAALRHELADILSRAPALTTETAEADSPELRAYVAGNGGAE